MNFTIMVMSLKIIYCIFCINKMAVSVFSHAIWNKHLEASIRFLLVMYES